MYNIKKGNYLKNMQVRMNLGQRKGIRPNSNLKTVEREDGNSKIPS